jgi:hypothetical protein
MNKAGKKKISATVMVMGVIGVLVVGLLAFIAFGTQQAALPSDKDVGSTIGNCPESTAGVSFSAVNALSKSTTVNTTQTVKVNGGPSAAAGASYPVGSKLEILWSAGDFINKITTYDVVCGGGVISTDLYATDTQTIRLFNTNNQPIAGDVNQSAIAAGGSASIEMKIDGKDKQSSGQLIVVLEDTNSSAVDKLTLAGLPGIKETTVPTFYTVSSAGAKAYAYSIDPVIGANTVTGTLGIQLKSGQTYTAQAIKVSMYSVEGFEDTDGTFKVGVENADGTAKYEDVTTTTFYVD